MFGIGHYTACLDKWQTKEIGKKAAECKDDENCLLFVRESRTHKYGSAIRVLPVLLSGFFEMFCEYTKPVSGSLDSYRSINIASNRIDTYLHSASESAR